MLTSLCARISARSGCGGTMQPDRSAAHHRYAAHGHFDRAVCAELAGRFHFVHLWSELRQMALIIILIKAGLSLNLSDLKKSADRLS